MHLKVYLYKEDVPLISRTTDVYIIPLAEAYFHHYSAHYISFESNQQNLPCMSCKL